MMFSDAEALLFQSAERALIDVKSIHVTTNEMEEILQLLTERDIEHTNNPPPPAPPQSYAYPYSTFPRHTLQSNSVSISLSVSAARSVCVIQCAFTQSPLTFRRILPYIFSGWAPFHLFTLNCGTTKASLSYFRD